MSVFQVDSAGELVRDRQGFVRITGLPEISQNCTVYLSLFLGEVPQRIDLGVDWPNILAFATSEDAIAQEVERAVLSRPGIVALDQVEVELDGLERSAAVSYRATASLADLRRRVLIDGQVDVRV